MGRPHWSQLPYRPSRQPLQRDVERRHLLPRRLEQGGGVLALERERRALRVVLVVGPGRTRRLRQPREIPLERGHPLPGARLLGQQYLTLRRHMSLSLAARPLLASVRHRFSTRRPAWRNPLPDYTIYAIIFE